MKLRSIEELEQLTLQELVHEARVVISVYGLDKAHDLLKNYVTIGNKKMKETTDRINKKYGMKRSSPKIWTITDFQTFKI